MKKRGNDSVARLQAAADKQGVRLQQANARGDLRDMTDRGVIQKMLKRGLKDHEDLP